MSCFDTYLKIQKTTPEELVEAARTNTGYGNLNLILMVRAANFWHESLTTLTIDRLRGYCRHTIDYLYPNLITNNTNLYYTLTFRSGPDNDMSNTEIKEQLKVIYNYQWWLGFVIGPNGCTRDIAYANELLDLPTNEEWSNELEMALIKFQASNSYIEEVTGYACAETFKRLRLIERSDFI